MPTLIKTWTWTECKAAKDTSKYKNAKHTSNKNVLQSQRIRK